MFPLPPSKKSVFGCVDFLLSFGLYLLYFAYEKLVSANYVITSKNIKDKIVVEAVLLLYYNIL